MPTQPSASESSGERSLEDNTTERGRPLEALNKYLRSHSKRPIRSQLSIPWQNASERSKRYYIRKAGHAATAVGQDIAPDDSAFLFQELSSSRVVRSTLLCIDKDSDSHSMLDETLVNALTHVLQDLPFGERTVTLSTKETIKVPNVIRKLLPERIVKQYGSYC